uniref:Uncharacterized protein n=1 Tax=Setaria italica TaxID=4555 RepID=K3ZMF8_SETIT
MNDCFSSKATKVDQALELLGLGKLCRKNNNRSSTQSIYMGMPGLWQHGAGLLCTYRKIYLITSLKYCYFLIYLLMKSIDGNTSGPGPKFNTSTYPILIRLTKQPILYLYT